MVGDAVLVRQEAAQEVHVSFTPLFDFDEVVGSDNGGAQDQKQDFGERLEHLDQLSWVLQRGEMVEQGRGFAWMVHGGLRIGTRHPRITFRSC